MKSFYKELNGFEVSNSYDDFVTSEIESRSYYWLEVENKGYILHFDKSLEFHKRAFLLFVAVSGAKKESWSDQNNCQLLTDAFDNFYKTSCFFSFMSNKQSEKFYEFSTGFLEVDIIGEVEVEETKTIVKMNSELKKLNVCRSLLEKVQIGTNYWSQFYKVEDGFLALFLETYYILYQETNKNSQSLTLFRNADVTELVFISFKTEYLNEIIVVSDTEASIEIIFKRSVDVHEKNKCMVRTPNTLLSKITLSFYLIENKNNQVKFLLDDTELKFYVETLPIEKLPRVGQMVYFLENNFRKKVTVEVPIYFFGEKLELSKLAVGFRIIREKLSGSNQFVNFLLRIDFMKKETCATVNIEEETYHICFYYIVKTGKIG